VSLSGAGTVAGVGAQLRHRDQSGRAHRCGHGDVRRVVCSGRHAASCARDGRIRRAGQGVGRVRWACRMAVAVPRSMVPGGFRGWYVV
jgi:hypothetical protein